MMELRPSITDAERDLFVDYLRERPFMYEKKNKDYKDAPRRKREWEACANLVGRTVELLQGWLKSRRSMLGKVHAWQGQIHQVQEWVRQRTTTS